MASLNHAEVVNPLALECGESLVDKIYRRAGEKGPLPLFNRASHHVSRYQRLAEARGRLQDDSGMTVADRIADSIHGLRLAIPERPKPGTVESFARAQKIKHRRRLE
jgi:hypothetical protein